MHADRQRALRDSLATALAPLGSDTSWAVLVDADAVVPGVEHSIRFGSFTARYTVEAGDADTDIAAGLAAAAAPLVAAIDPITVTAVGAEVTATSSKAFPCIAEPPLTTVLPDPSVIPVVWANQSAPQPDSDYVSLNPGQDSPEGREEVEAGVHAVMETTVIRSNRVQVVDVLLVGEWSGVTADDVRRALETPAFGVTLDPFVVRNVAVLLDATASQDTMWSLRIAVSVELAYADARRVKADPIETVEATGTVGTQPINITEP